MTKPFSNVAPLRSVFDLAVPAWLSRALGISFGVALIGLGAHVKVFLPGTPVPVTLQTLMVLLAGAFLRPLDAVAAVVAYIALGAAGVPLFAGVGVGGLAYLAGPTGGYLAGFLLAALLVGHLMRTARGPVSEVVILGAGAAVILLAGMVHLAFFLHMGFARAFALGVVPFLYGDAVKVAVAWTCLRLRRSLRSGRAGSAA